MRITALGTGMPNQSPSNAAAAFLVELGNGDAFVFDIGTGSTERLAGLQVDYSRLDKVFVSHLHTDHVGDLATLWVAGGSAVAIPRSTFTARPAKAPNSAPRYTSIISGTPGPGT
jgi:ribonuclease BN (tRNA processing enzyme)